MESDGTARVGVYTEDGTYHEMNGEIMDIHKILMSVSMMVDAGHEVHFKKYGSHVKLRSGKILPLKRENGVYVLPFMDASCFPWQGNRL